MKLIIGISAAFASLAAASQQAAEVYILPAQQSTSTPPAVSPSLARLILLQRLASPGNGPSTRDMPSDADPEEVLSLLNKFGKPQTPLFDGRSQAVPSQLVVMLEGMTEGQIKDMGAKLKTRPAFSIDNPPSSAAHESLIKNDFYNVGVTNQHHCSLDKVVNPLDSQCWSGKSTVAKYDVSKDSEALQKFINKLSGLVSLANSKEMDTTLVLLPATTNTKASKQWSDKPQELRRRQATEAVMSAEDSTGSSPATSSNDAVPVFHAAKGPIPSCFQSEDSCVTGTKNCSGHGTCLNRFAKADGSNGKDICFTCHCGTSRTGNGSVTHWAGAACSKQDISVQFWLFAGFTLALVTILYMAIALLFNVGNEKLPGVIGAGVSRSK